MADRITLDGIIMHAISGFYYVEAADSIYECRAKGNFRNKGLSPLTGDRVEFSPDGDKGFILRIKERKNFLLRPPVANIDKLFIMSSADKPRPNLFVIDKLSAFAVYHKIEPVIVFTKTDLADVSVFADIYRRAGFPVVCCSTKSGEGIEELAGFFSPGVYAFSGNSGVGKSSLLNELMPGLSLETNEISEKLGRGKHTTRSVRLYHFRDALIADTPGFSSIELTENGEVISKESLADCFPEFSPFTENCRFSVSCSHVNDRGCAVVAAVREGLVPEQRHQSYCKMYADVKKINPWDQKS